jgi:NADP-dependent 3-hydroxy acid dehydrogenase YdfG
LGSSKPQEELRADGIRVTALCPGWVNTDPAAPSGLPESYRDVVLQPVDVADAVAFVLAQPPHVVV